MKQVQINGREVLLFKFYGKDFHLNKNGQLEILNSYGGRTRDGEDIDNDISVFDLPSGFWRILGSGKASEITEEDVAKEFGDNDTRLFFKIIRATRENGFSKETTIILVKQ